MVSPVTMSGAIASEAGRGISRGWRRSRTFVKPCLTRLWECQQLRGVDFNSLSYLAVDLKRPSATRQHSQVDAGALSRRVAAIAHSGRVAYSRTVGFRDPKTIALQLDKISQFVLMTMSVMSAAATMVVERASKGLELQPGW